MIKKSVCEKETFRHIFSDCFEPVKNFVYYQCGDNQVSEDIVQESLIILWENCIKVSFEEAKGYVYKVAKNKVLNHFKHKKVVLNYNKKANQNTSSLESPEYLIELKEFEQKLMTSIQELPDNQRVCYLLSRIDKKTYREIAEIEGVSVKAIEKRMQLALEKLKSKLGKNHAI